MDLETLTSALESAVIPVLLIFALTFLFFTAKLFIQRNGFGANPLNTTRIFLRCFAQTKLSEVWQHQLSPQLKEKICGEDFASAEVISEGLEHLEGYRERHAAAFPQANFDLFSVHKVPIGDQHRELIMVRGIARDSTRGVIVWLTRSTLSAGGWRVDDLYVQPPKGQRPPANSLTLSGKVPKKGFMKAAQSEDQKELEKAIAEDQFTELPEENSLLGVPLAEGTPVETSNAEVSSSPKPKVVSQSPQRKDKKVTVVKL